MIEIIVGLILLYVFRFAGTASKDDDIEDYLMLDYVSGGELDGDIFEDSRYE